MTTSQFTIYRSSDVGAPVLNGLTGSLISVFDACLVNGYGSKTAAGWTHPIPTESSSAYPLSGSVFACYQQPSGSKLTLFIHDGGPNLAAVGKEAAATGWETITSMSAQVGDGLGQFPLPAQALTDGHVQIRKSAATNATARPWMMFADSRTFYFYALTGDAYWYPFYFGDVFSLKSFGKDYYKCMIMGREAENVITTINLPGGGSTATYISAFIGSLIYFGGYTVVNYSYGSLTNAASGLYIARTAGGGGVSVSMGLTWDIAKTVQLSGGSSLSYNWGYLRDGVTTVPNSTDNALYLSPLMIGETNRSIRGRFRGMYVLGHPGDAFSDGQVISGGGDWAGKQFMLVKGIEDGAYYGYRTCHVIEISATVETNDE